MNTIKDTLEYIIKSITPDSESVTVTERIDNDFTILEITAPPEITGQIIGKQGRIIKAIRTMIGVSHPDSRFTIDIKN
jgi:hypothetical protein